MTEALIVTKPTSILTDLPESGLFGPQGKYDPQVFKDALVTITGMTGQTSTQVGNETVEIRLGPVANFPLNLRSLEELRTVVIFSPETKGPPAMTKYNEVFLNNPQIILMPDSVTVIVPEGPNVPDRATRSLMAAAALAAEIAGATLGSHSQPTLGAVMNWQPGPIRREMTTNLYYWLFLSKLGLGDKIGVGTQKGDGTARTANEMLLLYEKDPSVLDKIANGLVTGNSSSKTGNSSGKEGQLQILDWSDPQKTASQAISQVYEKVNEKKSNVPPNKAAATQASTAPYAATQVYLKGLIELQAQSMWEIVADISSGTTRAGSGFLQSLKRGFSDAVANLRNITKAIGKEAKNNPQEDTELVLQGKVLDPKFAIRNGSTQPFRTAQHNNVSREIKALKATQAIAEFTGALIQSGSAMGSNIFGKTIGVFNALLRFFDGDKLDNNTLNILTRNPEFLVHELVQLGLSVALDPTELRLLPSLDQLEVNNELRKGYPSGASILQRELSRQFVRVVKGTQTDYDYGLFNKAAKQQLAHEAYLREQERLRQQREAEAAAEAERQKQEQAANNQQPVMQWQEMYPHGPMVLLPVSNPFPNGVPAYNTGGGSFHPIDAVKNFLNRIFGPKPSLNVTGNLLPSGPLLLDLDGDGIETTSTDQGIYFDHDLDGTAELTAWVDTDDGLLAWDRNGNGIIDDATEIFGDLTPLSNGDPAGNGFAALAEVDKDSAGISDGKIDRNDVEFKQLRVLTGTGGLYSLDDLNIESLSLTYTPTSNADENGNIRLKQGTYRIAEQRDARGRIISPAATRELSDIGFLTAPSLTSDTQEIDLTPEVQALPDAPGYQLTNLRQAMLRDSTGSLKILVEDYVAESDPAERLGQVDLILSKWANVNVGAPDYKAQVLEQFFGVAPASLTAEEIESLYFGFRWSTSAQLAFRSHLSQFVKNVNDFDSPAEGIAEMFADAKAQILSLGVSTDAGKNLLYEFVSAVRGIGFDLSEDFDALIAYFSTQSPELRVLVESAGKIRVDVSGATSFDLSGSEVRYIAHSIIGGTGANSLIAGSVNDFVAGGSGDDTIFGGEGGDLVDGDDGNDVVYGQLGKDTISGGAGDDQLEGGASRDTLIGGTGDDLLHGGGGDDTYYVALGDGTDTIDETTSTDSDAGAVGTSDDFDAIRFAAGINQADLTFAADGTDLLINIGSSGDQTIRILGQLDGTRSNARIEQLEFADGSVLDYRAFNSGPQTMAADSLIGTTNADSLFGMAGNDTITADAGSDYILAGTGDDTVSGDAGADNIWGEEGNDSLLGGDGDDQIIGGAGNDTMDGGAGNDVYIFSYGAGQDRVIEAAGVGDVADTVLMAGILLEDITATTPNGQDLILTLTDGSTLTIVGQLDTDATKYVEQFMFDDGTVMTSAELLAATALTHAGSTSNDSVFGSSGDDVLAGQAGNDTLSGGAGDDLYVFNSGDGLVTIDENAVSDDGLDTLVFAEGVDKDDLVFTATSGNDLVITNTQTGDSITVTGHFGVDTSKRIETVAFSDGTSIDYTALPSLLQTKGTTGDDNLIGSTLDEKLDASSGADTMDGGAGFDTLLGGAGNDLLTGGVDGDTYIYNRGDGDDVIIDNLTASSGVDKIVFGPGITLDDLTFSRPLPDDLAILIDGGGSITIQGQYSGDSGRVIEYIAFSDGTTFAVPSSTWLLGSAGANSIKGTAVADFIQAYAGNDTVHGGAGNDVIVAGDGADRYIYGEDNDDVISGGLGADKVSGGKGNDVIYGAGENDVLAGDDGNDTLYGGAGNDVLTGGTGDNVLFGDAGDDRLTGGASNDTIDGGEGNDIISAANGNNSVRGGDGADNITTGIGSDTVDGGSGDDALTTGAGDDWLTGGTGADLLSGGDGNDTYLYNLGDGSDTIKEYGAGDEDAIQFGAGISWDDITLNKDGTTNDLLISIAGQTDRIRVKGFFAGTKIEKFVFVDGTEMPLDLYGQWSAILGTDGNDKLKSPSLSDVRGFAGNDTLLGGSLDDNLFGDEGNDSLVGDAGADIMVGGKGLDSLLGGAGNDIYYYELGDGSDTISDTAGVDRIEFGEGIGFSDVIFARDAENPTDLLVSISGSTDMLRIKNHYSAKGTGRIESFFFWENGTELTYAQLPAATAVFGTDGNDLLPPVTLPPTPQASVIVHGFAGNDTLNGRAGDDRLYGESGNDSIIGNSGNDTVIGSSGNDTYVYNINDGDDVIIDAAGFGEYSYDTLHFGAGITAENLQFSGSGITDLIITVTNGETVGHIKILGQFAGDIANKIESITFEEAGEDTIFSSDIPAQLKIEGDNSDNILPGTNVNVGEAIFGYDGNDVINAAGGNDSLYGGNGDDTLNGSIGHDVLQGDAGSDTLNGSWGSDRYIFNTGDGADTILESNKDGLVSADIIEFGNGIDGTDLTLTASGSSGEDLTISLGAGDSITVLGQLGADANKQIEGIKFADGSIVTSQFLKAGAQLGTAADDSLAGGSGNDILVSSGGADTVYGQGGDDTIYGGMSGDTLLGGDGDDTYVFNLGDGVDRIIDSGSINSDTISFGSGIAASDLIISRDAGTEDLIIAYGSAANTIRVVDHFSALGTSRIEKIKLADGTIIQSDDFPTIEAISGTERSDAIAGSASSDVVYAYEGSDVVDLNDGDDTGYGGSGNDVIRGLAGSDTLYGQVGEDNLYGGDGDDLLDGGTEDDFLVGGAGNDTYIYSDGYDLIDENNDTGASTSDTVVFGDGITVADVAFSRTGTGGEDLTISLRGTDRSLTILGQFGSNPNKQVENFQFADETRSVAGGLPIITGGTEDDDTISGTALADVFDGNEGDDSLSGLGGNDILYGSDGYDTIDAGGGDDILVGGTGDDSLAGADGDDIYSFARGDGDDVITEAGSAIGDKIRFRDINLVDVNFRASGTEDLVIEILPTGETIKVLGQLGTDSNKLIESIEFADGTEISDLSAYLVDHLTILTTEGNDYIVGSDLVLGDSISALGGNDTIYAGAGPDNVDADDGDDYIDGGSGDDTLTGGLGSDTYLFTRGQGADVINELIDLATTIGIDTIKFADDIAPEEVQFSASGNDLVITLIGTSDSVTIKNQFVYLDPSMQMENVSAVEQFVFANGTSYTDVPPLTVVGTTGGDSLTGSDFSDTITASDGDDVISAGRRDDSIAGEIGNDTLDAGSGNDIISGGAGDDILTGGTGDDTYIFASDDGADQVIESSIAGEDGGIDAIDLSGADGADSVTLSRQGDDLIIAFPDGIQSITVKGQFSNQPWKRVEYIKLQSSTIDIAAEFAASAGANDDSYSLNLGDGSIVVTESDATASDKDVLTFGEGIAASQLMFEADGEDLVVSVLGTEDKVTVSGQYSSDPANKVEEFKLSDGTAVGETLLHEVTGNGVVVGTEQSDVIRASGTGASLFGDLGNDVLIGTSGADKLYGNEGNDRLLGTAGNDTLIGGQGDDVYFFDTAFGAVVVDESAGDGNDTIQFGAGITAGDLSWSANGKDVILSVAGSGASWKLVGQLQDDAVVIESVRLADGTIIDGEQLKFGEAISGTSGADSLTGSELFDTIYGDDDNDTISGGSGQDTLYGGDGDDVVSGGTGSDTLFGDAGNDSLDGGENDDVLDGSDGDDILTGGAGNNSLAGGVGNDSLVGGNTDDTLDGGTGVDTLQGGAGNDLYKFSSSSGNQTIDDLGISGGDGGIDTVEIDSALTLADLQISRTETDLLITVAATGATLTIKNQFADDGTQRIENFNIAGTSYSYQYLPQLMSLQGTIANDSLNGEAWTEYIYGQSGNDTINAGDGDDVLIGGVGSDSLLGGTGSDTYLFNVGDSEDTILEETDGGTSDTLLLGDGLTLENVTFTRPTGTDDLVLSIDGTSDAITISNYFNDVLENISIGDVDLDRAAVEALIPARKGTEAADLLSVDETAFRTYGLGGADTIYGQDGAETIFAGAGDDIAYAADGSDRLEGGDGADTLLGEAGDDSIYGEAGIDSLVGGAGADLLDGGSGNDVLDGGIGSDQLSGGGGNDILHAGDDSDIAFGGDGYDSLYGDAGDDALYGEEGEDTLLGGDGADTISGGIGNDTVFGGAGNDTYVFNSGDGVDEIAESTTGITGSGNDVLSFGDGIMLADLVVARDGNDIVITLDGTDDRITLKNQLSGDSADVIEQIAFGNGLLFDTDILLQGNDIDGTDSADNLSGTWRQESLYGHDGADTIAAGAMTDFIDGGDGNDVLAGNEGDDTVLGGMGDDVYQFASGDGNDTISEVDSTGASGGTDTLVFGAGITPADIITARSGDDLIITFIGSSDQITLVNQFGDDDTQKVEFIKFEGEPAQSIQVLYNGPDIQGTSGNDTLAGTWQRERIYGYGGDDTLTGDLLEDSLFGGDGNDTLDGQAGIDLLAGGAGNDTYYIDNTGDFIYEATGEGTDTVISSVSHHLYNNVDNLVLTGSSNLTGTGNALDNMLTGNSGNNTLDGGIGSDTMYGGAGNDRYMVDNASDLVVEDSDIGADTVVVYGNFNYTLQANVENLTVGGYYYGGALSGNSLKNYMLGNDYNNTLLGGAGNDTLDGGAGADSLDGGDGDDLYNVDDANDVVNESGIGTDTVQSSVTYSISLQSAVENLTLTGTANNKATGNSGANVLTGNTGNNSLAGGAGDDTIYGGGGTDTLVGGDGNDSFYVDSLTDLMTETSTGGTADTEFATFSDTLYTYIEHLTLLGTDDLTGTGNASANILTGNSGNNTLNGSSGNDTLYGNDGNDSLYGGTGTDSMVGGLGNDVYNLDNVNDAVIELADEGTDTVIINVSYTLGANVENLTFTGAGNVTGTGNGLNNVITGTNLDANSLNGNNTLIGGAGNDTLYGLHGHDSLYGGDGNDVLDGGLSNDTMVGGLGNDSYYVSVATDVVTENPEEGTADTIYSAVTLTLVANVENLVLTGTSIINATGNAQDNFIGGNSNDNTLGGADGNDVLSGGGGDDTLDGGLGNDTLGGGAGNDIFKIYDLNDIVLEDADAGTDTIISTVDYSLVGIANVEGLTLTSGLTATGNELNNTITGNASNNTINGGAGADSMIGVGGDDTYYVDNAGDTVTDSAGTNDAIISSVTYTLPTGIEQLTLASGAGNIGGTGNTVANTIVGNSSDNSINGGDGADTLIGGDGNDTLDGGAGADHDSLVGGLGNDVYVIDNALDMVVEFADQGSDTVRTTVSYTLADTIENLTLISGAISGTGNTADNNLVGSISANTLQGMDGNDSLYGDAGNDSLVGGSGDDTMNGGAGTDRLVGGSGNDVYYLDGSTDVIVEQSGEGSNDTAYSSATYTLSAEIERLILTGNASITGTGNASNNYIAGNSGANTLNGSTGIDTLEGGGGDDTYVVDDLADVVIETPTGGFDTISTTISYSLASLPSIEGIVLTGTGNVNATGNNHNNSLTANSGNNVLDGGLGVDTMIGGAGNDTYVVDNSSDVVTEAASAGTDSVQSSVSYSLGANLENLTLTGSANISGTGNTLANYITGNSGNNILDGGTGNDTMAGGAGNDTYRLNVVTDQVIENADEGTDTIELATATAGTTYVLQAEVENLVMGATNAFHGMGNARNNYIIGNTAANSLTGAAGNDTLDGGAGNDTLLGGTGDDFYYIDSAGDYIIENGGEGFDTVFSSLPVAYLPSNIEGLRLIGNADIFGDGNSQDNLIIGNSGNNIMHGEGGVDTIYGGAGNDHYYLSSASDVVAENAEEGIDTIILNGSYTLGSNFENLEVMGGGHVGIGNELDNEISENASSGNNTLVGGLGNDTYIVEETNTLIVESAEEGIDTVRIQFAPEETTYSLAANMENLTLESGPSMIGIGNSLDNRIISHYIHSTLIGGDGDDSLRGDNYSDSLLGGDGDDTLNGGAGGDTLVGGAGNDFYYVFNSSDQVFENSDEGIDTVYLSLFGSYTLAANIENVVINNSSTSVTGNSADNLMLGSASSDTLDGGAGDDTLAGGSGVDTLIGGKGSDYYLVDSSTDLIIENANEGTDSVQASESYSLSANVENLTLTGSGNTSATGNSLNNTLTGNSGNNTLDGGLGADAMNGGAGNDTYIVDNTADSITDSAGTDSVISAVTCSLASQLENLTLTGNAPLSGYGNALSNILVGNEGNNTLKGNGGTDTFVGGLGDDVYFIQTAGTVTEASGEGIDTVISNVSYTLDTNVENLVLTGSSTTGTGNAANNYMTGSISTDTLAGSAGNDTLDGAGGADSLDGGSGDDTYYVDSSSDVVTESAANGTDTVISTANAYTLGANVENLTLGGTGNLAGSGNSADNVLTGNSGNNTLDGGTGYDTLSGGTGNDTYIVDDLNDLVIELAGAGTDTIQTGISYSLSENIENLTLTGSGTVSGIGNSAANFIVGNSGNNTLDGGTGIDTMIGGIGDDLYIVDDSEDTIEENNGGGTDSVLTAVSYSLSANVENLTLTGSASINATGNASNNLLTGNSGDNILDAGLGTDTVAGGQGDDTYIIDGTDDVISENASEGIDTVEISSNYTLLDNFENLLLIGQGNVSGTGNDDDNIIDGNGGDNTLDGGDGSDTLAGGAGNDTYLIDSDDLVNESANQGTDTIVAGFGYSLGAHFENLILSGSGSFSGSGNSLSNVLTGSTGDNLLEGGTGDDTLTGGTGIDTLIGGTGNDLYVMDSISDVVTENADEGTDTVQIESSYTLGANVENLILGGTGELNGTGNTLANYITGTSGANTLIGEAGNDTLEGAGGIDTLMGGSGDDTYFVTVSGATLMENASEGIDTIISSLNYTLGENFENLTITGSATGAFGNSGDNYLKETSNSTYPWVTLNGGTGNDTLDFGLGTDWLDGGDGNDLYIVNSTDQSSSALLYDSSGTDTLDLSDISSNIAFSGNGVNTGSGSINLYGSVEIVIAGSGNDTLQMAGSSISSTLYGGAGNDTIASGSGNDELHGDSGDDYLVGNTGDDTYFMSLGGGADTIDNSYSYSTETDAVKFDSSVSDSEIAIYQNGLDLEIGYNRNGNTDKVTVKNQVIQGIDRLVLDDGRFLTEDDINQIIQQMSVYASNNDITIGSLNDVKGNAALMNIIATSWHS